MRPAFRSSSTIVRCSRAKLPWCARAISSSANSLRRNASRSASRRLLTNAAAWTEVAAFNQLKNPNAIPIGITLRIPYRLLRSEGGASEAGTHNAHLACHLGRRRRLHVSLTCDMHARQD